MRSLFRLVTFRSEDRRALPRAVGAALVIAFLGTSLAACSGDDDSGASSSKSVTQGAAQDKSADLERDMIVKPLEAVGATKVDYDDDTVRAHFDGSTEGATAWTYCSAVEAVGDGRAAILVYADGELVCAERHDD